MQFTLLSSPPFFFRSVTRFYAHLVYYELTGIGAYFSKIEQHGVSMDQNVNHFSSEWKSLLSMLS